MKGLEWLFRDPPLEEGETILWSKKVQLGPPSTAAPDVTVPVVAVLYLTTNYRLLFVPNRGNRKFYSQPRIWSALDIQEVGVQERDWTPYTGGFQKRMRITLPEGTLLFVITSRDETIAELRRVLQKIRRDSQS